MIKIEFWNPTSALSILVAAVQIGTWGQMQLTATSSLNSSAMPRAHIDMLYLAMVYAVDIPNHFMQG